MSSKRANHKDDESTGGASIYDVCKKADVSIVTVSRVFNDYPHVSQRMRERVFAAAREVGYKPRLVSKRQVIAVILGHLDHLSAGDYKTRLVLQIVQEAAKREYLVEFIPYDSIDLATQHHVDGIIEVGLTRDELTTVKGLPRVPTVLTNKDKLRSSWCAVCSDHYQEGQMATEHLAAQGHKRIALVVDELDGWGPEQRTMGYESVLSDRFGNDAQSLIFATADDFPLQIARKMLDAQCTAAILLSDNAGLAVMDALVNECKLSIPEDFSVIGIENEAVSRFINPRLTTIEQPLPQIAEGAVSYIINQIKGKSRTVPRVYKSQLIPRDSVAPPKS